MNKQKAKIIYWTVIVITGIVMTILTLTGVI